MKKANQILSVFLGMIFIVSTTGVLIYKTHCLCTGTEQVGIYIQPESCEKDFHLHHDHDESGNEIEANKNCCHECSPKNHDCGCASPEIRFFKLTNEITKDDVNFDRSPEVKVAKIILTAIVIFAEPDNYIDTGNSYSESPPKIKSSKNFLIQVNQLKIPLSA